MTAKTRTIVFFAASKKLSKALDKRAKLQGITKAELLRRTCEKLVDHQGKRQVVKPAKRTAQRSPSKRQRAS